MSLVFIKKPIKNQPDKPFKKLNNYQINTNQENLAKSWIQKLLLVVEIYVPVKNQRDAITGHRESTKTINEI